jgi:hypothetical protein
MKLSALGEKRVLKPSVFFEYVKFTMVTKTHLQIRLNETKR